MEPLLNVDGKKYTPTRLATRICTLFRIQIKNGWINEQEADLACEWVWEDVDLEDYENLIDIYKSEYEKVKRLSGK